MSFAKSHAYFARSCSSGLLIKNSSQATSPKTPSRVSSQRPSCMLRTVKTPTDHQSNIQTMNDYSLGFQFDTFQSAVSQGLLYSRPSTAQGSHLSPNSKSKRLQFKQYFIQPGLKQLSAFEISELFRRRKKDCSLSNLFSLQAEQKGTHIKSKSDLEPRSPAQIRDKNIQTMVNCIFQKKGITNRSPTSKGGQNSQDQSFPDGFPLEQSLSTTKRIQRQYSSGPKPVRPQSNHMNKSQNLPKFTPFESPDSCTPKSNQLPGNLKVHRILNKSTIDLNSKSSKRKEISSNPPDNLNQVIDAIHKKQTKLSRPNTAMSKAPKRPPTSNTSLRLDTGLLKLNAKLPEPERARLDAYIEADFQSDLIYSKREHDPKDDLKMGTLMDVKKYMAEKDQTDYKMHLVLEEFRRKVPRQTVNNSLLNLSQIRGQELPPDPFRMMNFELITTNSSHRLPNTIHKTFLSPEEKAANDVKKESERQIYLSSEADSMAQMNLFKKVKTIKTIKQIKTVMMKSKAARRGTLIQNNRFKRIRKALKDRLLKLAKLGLSLQEVVEKKVFPTRPYQLEGSEAFFRAVKCEDIERVQSFLRKNRFYCFQFDNVKQTGLHWSAKRGYSTLCQMLIAAGAEVNAQDLTLKTPLYYALREGRSEIVRLLLFNKADPWSSKPINYKSICKDERCLRYLQKARKLSIMLAFNNFSSRDDFWNREVDNLLAPVVGSLI